ncbi:nuclease-related domain-containing protein [Pedobacter metabolipauper]|uniref:Nuclease-like protein n=1 Tax=Pedobacter metabolipauper TaxID=425513 RepID=A0A4R6STC5_9SPHI|nr:nuclease-related domain-containing protein [Pedobacter metabolipauper]TDQ07153.1 nuclease-like protein [Pedobacter metabolipauper]
MCKVYNEVGCITTINSHLIRNNINDLKSLKEIIDFKNSYADVRKEIISHHTLLIEQEKKILEEEISHLKDSIIAKENEVREQLLQEIEKLKYRLTNLIFKNVTVFRVLTRFCKKIILKLKIWTNKLLFSFRIKKSIQHLIHFLTKKTERYEYIVSFFNDAVEESSLSQTKHLDKKKAVIDEINNSIYGALGEQMVVKELKTLADDYILINDFNCTFDPPLYNSRERNYIRSIQVDHILISPFGVFIIETKNWSKESQNNLSLRSPVEQIKRTNLALYKMLVSEESYSDLMLSRHHWGERKVPLKNIIVLINQKPIEEFKYVKVLTLNQLLGYIKYFEPTFSTRETQKIADYLLARNFRAIVD